MRRPKLEPVNHERWLVSYADFVTLMFAFFVALYAISLKDRSSATQMSRSVRQAVKSGGVSDALSTLLADKHEAAAAPAKKTDAVNGSLRDSYQRLSREMHDEIQTGAVRVQMERRGLVITLQETAFYPSGEDSLFREADVQLAPIAKVLRDIPNAVQLEGHTDSVPIHTARFKNNWELSAARSIALLQVFQSKYDLPPERFVVAGYGQNAPVATNDTAEGRARNRRVEIVILAAHPSTPERNPEGNPTDY